MQRAEAACLQQGVRLTELRRQVLSLVWENHSPTRAYDILARLKEKGRRPAPPTAYRALEFLRSAGLVHRIESLNAYVGCADPMVGHSSQFFICDRCDAVAEVHDTGVTEHLTRNAERLGLHTARHTVEIHGICTRCYHNDQT